MGNPNSRRARRRQRGRNNSDPDLVYWMGRWLVRTYTGTSNEAWNKSDRTLGEPYRVGDVLGNRHDQSWREIVAIRGDGYEWRYPDVPDKTFLSADSTAPYFEWSQGWYLAHRPAS